MHRTFLQHAGSFIQPLLLILAASCSWIGPEREWDNPYDHSGTNRADPPEITAISGDTTVAINDSLTITVEASSGENARVTHFLWSSDGGTSFDTVPESRRSFSWGIGDTGIHQVMAGAINEWGMVSEFRSLTISVKSYSPSVSLIHTDASISQDAVVQRTFIAEDSNGKIVMYLWGTGESGWDDSIASSNYATATFSHPEGGDLRVRWAARDDDGLEVLDTFHLLFNRGPTSVILTDPACATAAPFLSFNMLQNSGSLLFSYFADDPDDSTDTITYAFFLGTSMNDTVIFYQGRNTDTIARNILPSTMYVWTLLATDLFGDTCSSSGKFVTAPPPSAPEGMVMIPGTSTYFQMGQSGFDSSEEPIHAVGFSYHFWIDSVEVTNEQFAAVLDLADPDPTAAAVPVIHVSWFDAAVYCNARSTIDDLDSVYSYESVTGAPGTISAMSGLVINRDANGYRLPTESEWEYSCRIDSMTLFFWGNDASVSSEYAWTRENCDTVQTVALKKPNGFRIYDLSGNVWEWCNDWFDPDYYSSSSPQLDAFGPETGEQRVIRGGSWKHSLYFAQAGTRSKMVPEARAGTIGFRTVRVVK